MTNTERLNAIKTAVRLNLLTYNGAYLTPYSIREVTEEIMLSVYEILEDEIDDKI